MRRRGFIAALGGVAGTAGCLGSDEANPAPTTPTNGGETPTSVRYTDDGLTATFRVVDVHAPTDDTANATFDGDEVTVTGTMNPGGCRRPSFGSVDSDAADEAARLRVGAESPYGPESTVVCDNASNDYRCVLAVEGGHLTAVEVVHRYEERETRSFDLVES